nr:hypothetical protein [Tanacetum cinerariifolium]
MDLLGFTHVLDPTKVRLFKWEGAEEQEDRTVVGVRIVSEEDMVIEEPRRLRKKRKAATDAGGSFHPPKKLRSDYGTPNTTASAGKSPSGLREFLARSLLHVESDVEVKTTLPFVTSSISATLERDNGIPTAPERFVISSHFSHHSTNASKAEGSSIIRSAIISHVVIEVVIATQVASIPSTAAPEPSTKVVTPVYDSMFQGVHLMLSGRSFHWDSKRLTLKFYMKFLFQNGTFPMTLCWIVWMRPENLSIIWLLQFCLLKFTIWIMTSFIEFSDEEVEDLKAQLLLKEAEAAKAIHLCAKASNFKVVEKSFQDEVTALKGHNVIFKKERGALDGKVIDLAAFVTGKEHELTTLNAQLTIIKTQNNNLVNELKVVNDKLEKLYADFVDVALHLEEKFYPRLLTTIFGRRWLLTHGMELAVIKCPHSSKYLFSLGAAIGKAIEKEMQDGLAVEITHGAEGKISQVLGPHFVMFPISEPVSAKMLTVLGVLNTLPSPITTTLSTTLAFDSTLAPINVDDYGVVGTNDQASVDADPFPNVDDTDLNIP